MHIFVSAGEPSGDHHGADLIRALRARRPDATFAGFGGPLMKEAGATLLFPLVDLAVMWFLRVLLNIRTFLGVVKQADEYFRDARPDAVVLIDYPGLHWWIARKAKARGIPVFYYVPPQLWAWAGWRVKKVQKFVDHVLCSLPFEPEWYHARGVPQARYVGHPYFDELSHRVIDSDFVLAEKAKGGPVVAILPGSRTQELLRNLPIMLRAARRLHATRPDIRFVITCLHERHRTMAEAMVRDQASGLPLTLHAGRTPELIRVADVAWAVSGSVGLELLMEALPTVVLYKIRRIDLIIARPFIKARFISLVNLLAGEELMPEFLTDRDVSAELVRWASRWLNDPSERSAASARLAALRDRVAVPGASGRAADAILAALTTPSSPSPYRGMHATEPSRVKDHPHATGSA
ncbi:MAG: lipid-A-disaccharide synthase [Isosphaeraceae bacterium]